MKYNRKPIQQTQGKEKAPSAATLEGSKSTLTMQPKYANVNTPTSKKRKPRKWHETATAAQYAKIIELLTPCGRKIHTLEFREHGICAPAARIKELHDKHNVPIKNVMTAVVWDSCGYPHKGIAFYQMQCPNDKQSPT